MKKHHLLFTFLLVSFLNKAQGITLNQADFATDRIIRRHTLLKVLICLLRRLPQFYPLQLKMFISIPDQRLIL